MHLLYNVVMHHLNHIILTSALFVQYPQSPKQETINTQNSYNIMSDNDGFIPNFESNSNCETNEYMKSFKTVGTLESISCMTIIFYLGIKIELTEKKATQIIVTMIS